jgi:hydroxymethylbilane synthase
VPRAQELRLGTRGSQLALWQANAVASRLLEAGGPRCRIVVVKTSGDRLQEAPLSEIGGKRLFVKELEDALLRDEIDLAVHSSKDMPALLPEGLSIAAVLPREDPLDALVLPARSTLRLPGNPGIDQLVATLGQTPSFGTGSVRRVAQLKRLFSCARFTPIRGNLDTRLRKLDAGEHDVLVLAAAGLRRLGFADRISATLPVAACVPAPGQGIVAVEIRERDGELRQLLAGIDDADASAALEAERALVEALGGGCQTPVGAIAVPTDPDRLELVGLVVATDGSRAVRSTASGGRADATALGHQVAAALLDQGADAILADARREPASGVSRQAQVQSAALTDD